MNFENAVRFEIEVEGGARLVRDTGGLTKYGISQRAFPHLDIENLTLYQAEQIYKQYYWDRANCDSVLDELKLAVFDCAINQGVSHAVSLYRQYPDLRQYLDARAAQYRSLARNNPERYGRYLQGWLNRLNHVYNVSMSPSSYATPADYNPTDALVPPISGGAAPDVLPAPVEQPQVIDASYTPDIQPGGFMPFEEEDLLSEAKPFWRTLKPWSSLGLGGVSTGAMVQSDPGTLKLLEQLAHHPTFWFALAIVGLVAYIIYTHWQDHNRRH